jgi:tRNA(fMet)-specific endonuclease VapC
MHPCDEVLTACAAGAAQRKRQAALEVLPFTAGAAAHHGQLRAELERLGPSAGVCDMLIGAHTCTEDLADITNDKREFERMPDPRI